MAACTVPSPPFVRVCVRHVLRHTQGLFTHEGPTAEQLAQTTFTMTLVAHGYGSAEAAAAALAAAAPPPPSSDPESGQHR
jgi:hypothetical protein